MARTLSNLMQTGDFVTIPSFRTRLAELDKQVFDVYRTRNDQVLATLSTEDEASDYITENDYNPERVKVRQAASSLVSDENKAEAAVLRKIRDAVISSGGEKAWDSGKSLYLLLPGSEVIEVEGKRLVLLQTLFS